jgi:Tfp pilus assembly protein PilO
MTWLLKNWKLVAFALVVVALVATGWKLYRAGAANATLEYQVQHLTSLKDFYREQSIKFASSLEDHAKRTQADTARINELSKRITSLNEYAELASVRDGACFDDTDTERLRDLWTDPGSGSSGPASAPR